MLFISSCDAPLGDIEHKSQQPAPSAAANITPQLSSGPDTLVVGGRPTETILWNGQQITVIEGEIALKLAVGPGRAAVLDSVAARGAAVVRPLDKLGWMTVRIPSGDSLEAALERYRELPGVLFAEPNGIIREATLFPDDLDDRQWALNNTGQAPAGGTADADVDAPEAWDFATGSADVIIAILDSGIPMQNGQLSHPDLDDPNKMILGPDFIDPFQQNGVRDDHGHGTHVAGIAGAESNNATGIAGVCWSCRLMVIQTQDANGNGTPDSFYDGVVWAVDNTPSSDRLVINASLGSEQDSQRFIDAIVYAQNNNTLIIAAAGNENGGAVVYPAAHAPDYHNLMAVSSTDHNDVFSSFSSSGPEAGVRPLSVSITGPSQVNADQSYTWTANAWGGTPSYTYFWYWRSELTYPEWDYHSSTQLPDRNFTFYSYMVPPGWSTGWLGVVVHHQGSGTEEAVYVVRVYKPEG